MVTGRLHCDSVSGYACFGICMIVFSVVFYLIAIFFNLIYNGGSSTYKYVVDLTGSVLGLLPWFSCCFLCCLFCPFDKKSRLLLALAVFGVFSFISSILTFSVFRFETKEDVRNPNLLIAAGVLLILAGCFHCAGCACFAKAGDEYSRRKETREVTMWLCG